MKSNVHTSLRTWCCTICTTTFYCAIFHLLIKWLLLLVLKDKVHIMMSSKLPFHHYNWLQQLRYIHAAMNYHDKSVRASWGPPAAARNALLRLMLSDLTIKPSTLLINIINCHLEVQKKTHLHNVPLRNCNDTGVFMQTAWWIFVVCLVWSTDRWEGSDC